VLGIKNRFMKIIKIIGMILLIPGIVYAQISKDAYNSCKAFHEKKIYSEEAIQACSDAIEINPNDAELYYLRGFVYIEQKQFEKGITDSNKALQINPKHQGAYYNLGYAYILKKEFDQALINLNKSIELNPNHTGSYHARGTAHIAKNNIEQAISDFSKEIELDPYNWYAYELRGFTYLKRMNDPEKAFSDLMTAGELNPEKKILYDNFIATYTLLGEKAANNTAAEILEEHKAK
jgi:Flp pilus assembly protein TadD